MLQLSEKTESSLTKSIASISNSVPKLSKVLDLEKSKETGVWAVEPKKIHITINDPITVKAPKLITDGKEEKSDKSFISDIKKALGIKPKSAEEIRIKAEEKQKKADALAKKRHDKMKGWFKDMGNSLKKSLTDNPVVNFIKDHWGKIMFAAMALFLKPEQWKTIWQGIKNLWEWFKKEGIDIFKGTIEVLKEWVPKVFDAVVSVVKFIGKLIDNIFGKKVTQEDVAAAKKAGPKEGESKEDFNKRIAGMEEAAKSEKRQGGLFGEGGGIMDKLKGFGSLALLFVTGLALMTKSFTPIMMALKLFKGGLKLGGKGLKGFARQVSNIGLKDAKKGGLRRNARANQIKETRAANKAKFGDARGKQGLGSKVKKVGKVVAKKAGGAMTTAVGGASATPKPPTGGMSTTATGASKMGKWVSKFPKLAKGMKFLTKIPGPVGKAFMVGPLVASLAGGADKKTIIPMIGGMLGGIGGGTLGSLLGGMVGLAGGPLALVTGALGGIAGAMLGDSLGMGIAQWLVGDTVDALPFDWMNNILNGGKGSDEGGDLNQTPAGAGAGAGGKGKPPMTKTQFLQSEKYKGQMRDESGAVRGESTAGKQIAYEEYLEEEKNAPAIESSAKEIKKELKQAKRMPKVMREKRYAKLNRFLDNSPNGDAILRELKPRELKQLGRDGASSEGGDVVAPMAAKKAMLRSQMNADALAPQPIVSPTMKADTLNQVQGENAELSSGGDAVVAPTVINNYYNSSGGGENGTAIYGVPTAQKGQQHRHSNIR